MGGQIQEIFSVKSDELSLFATLFGVLLYTLFNIIKSISEFCIGSFSDHSNKKVLLALCGFGLFGLTSLLCVFTIKSLLFWVIVIACAGVSIGTVKVIEKSYTSLLLGGKIRGTGLALLQAVHSVGDFLSSVIVGLLWTFMSPVVAFLYAAVLSFVAMILFLLHKHRYVSFHKNV